MPQLKMTCSNVRFISQLIESANETMIWQKPLKKLCKYRGNFDNRKLLNLRQI